MPELLSIQGLELGIRGTAILRGVNLSLEKGACLGLVGESGSGKSMTALALMGLLPSGAKIEKGSIRLSGRELTGLGDGDYCSIRGAEVSMVFQEPFTCLNPVMRIDEQVAEPLQLHKAMPKEAALLEATKWLERVGIPDAAQKGRQYPHQWSGGMRQRAMIAMALACHPKLLIADEPTTALDVTVQAQILKLLKELTGELGISLLMISHDLGVIHAMADRVAVMQNGVVVEEGGKEDLYLKPKHEYTKALLASYLDWSLA